MDFLSKKYIRYLNSLDIDTSSFSIPYREPVQEYSFNVQGEKRKRTIEFDESIISDELKCPICLGNIEKTSTVMACLHRFCSECLHRSLRMELGPNKKTHECPACRVKIPSRRSSQFDPAFDKIVEIFNKEEEVLSAPVLDTSSSRRSSKLSNKKNSGLDMNVYRSLHQANIEKFRSKQKELAPSLNIKRKQDQEQLALQTLVQQQQQQQQALQKSLGSNYASHLVTFALYPWPEHIPEFQSNSVFTLTTFQRPFISASPTMTIGNLKEYIEQLGPRVINASSGQVELSFELKACDLEVSLCYDKNMDVPNGTTLLSICSDHWNKTSPLILYVRVVATSLGDSLDMGI